MARADDDCLTYRLADTRLRRPDGVWCSVCLNTAIGLFKPATLSYHLDLAARAVVATTPQATGRSGTAT